MGCNVQYLTGCRMVTMEAVQLLHESGLTMHILFFKTEEQLLQHLESTHNCRKRYVAILLLSELEKQGAACKIENGWLYQDWCSKS